MSNNNKVNTLSAVYFDVVLRPPVVVMLNILSNVLFQHNIIFRILTARNGVCFLWAVIYYLCSKILRTLIVDVASFFLFCLMIRKQQQSSPQLFRFTFFLAAAFLVRSGSLCKSKCLCLSNVDIEVYRYSKLHISYSNVSDNRFGIWKARFTLMMKAQTKVCPLEITLRKQKQVQK